MIESCNAPFHNGRGVNHRDGSLIEIAIPLKNRTFVKRKSKLEEKTNAPVHNGRGVEFF